LLLGGVVTPESGRLLELADDWVKRAVLVMRRAEIAQVGMQFRLKVLLQFHCQPRFADPRLTRQQHHLAFARLCL